MLIGKPCRGEAEFRAGVEAEGKVEEVSMEEWGTQPGGNRGHGVLQQPLCTVKY